MLVRTREASGAGIEEARHRFDSFYSNGSATRQTNRKYRPARGGSNQGCMQPLMDKYGVPEQECVEIIGKVALLIILIHVVD